MDSLVHGRASSRVVATATALAAAKIRSSKIDRKRVLIPTERWRSGNKTMERLVAVIVLVKRTFPRTSSKAVAAETTSGAKHPSSGTGDIAPDTGKRYAEETSPSKSFTWITALTLVADLHVKDVRRRCGLQSRTGRGKSECK